MVAWHRCRSLGATRPNGRRDIELGRRRFGHYVDGGGQGGGIAPKRVNGDSAWRNRSAESRGAFSRHVHTRGEVE